MQSTKDTVMNELQVVKDSVANEMQLTKDTVMHELQITKDTVMNELQVVKSDLHHVKLYQENVIMPRLETILLYRYIPPLQQLYRQNGRPF